MHESVYDLHPSIQSLIETAVLCESGQMSDSPTQAYSLTRLTVSGVWV